MLMLVQVLLVVKPFGCLLSRCRSFVRMSCIRNSRTRLPARGTLGPPRASEAEAGEGATVAMAGFVLETRGRGRAYVQQQQHVHTVRGTTMDQPWMGGVRH